MIRKKQILMVVSIAVISFLMGTVFNMNFIASGGSSSPWDKVWTAITGLESRVGAIEEEAGQLKTIRLHSSSETSNNQQFWMDGADFVWTPNNSTSNAILSIHCYFKYLCETDGLQFRIVVNGETHNGIGWLVSSAYNWSPVFSDVHFFNSGLKIYPNQDNYTISFQFAPQYYVYPAYVKDINIIIEVVDGFPIGS